jgi:hypothetical protein
VTNAKLRHAIGQIEQRLETHAVEKGE